MKLVAQCLQPIEHLINFPFNVRHEAGMYKNEEEEAVDDGCIS